MLFLSLRDVEARLDLDALIDALAPAMADLSSGAASSPARIAAQVPEVGGFLGAMPGYAEALDGAQITCATTHSVEPVVRRAWLDPGTHVTSVGFNAAGREVDDATIADALIVVESREAALAPYPGGTGDLREPLRDGIITDVHAELGEIISGVRPGRTDPDQITLYKSVGVAVQDAAAVALVLAAGGGQHVDM